MNPMIELARVWWRGRVQNHNSRGQAMTEYTLIVALIAIALIATVVAFRDQLNTLWTDMTTGLEQAPGTPG